MLDRFSAADAQAAFSLLGMEAAREAAATDEALSSLLHWTESYLMRPHPELGRQGAVCPFTKRAARLDTVRLAVSELDASSEAEAYRLMRQAFDVLDGIPCPPGMEHFRTVIIGFPNCAGEAGEAMLRRVQARHRFRALRHFRMIGFMHEGSSAPGLWNPDFRPLRAPLPIMAIRHLVEQDAPFAARHPLLLLPYLIRFPIAGSRRLASRLFAGGTR